MAVRIMQCTCITQSEFQDKNYGKGRRVFNQGGKETSKYRCSVCGREVRVN